MTGCWKSDQNNHYSYHFIAPDNNYTSVIPMGSTPWQGLVNWSAFLEQILLTILGHNYDSEPHKGYQIRG